jgi:hypothetical protein
MYRELSAAKASAVGVVRDVFVAGSKRPASVDTPLVRDDIMRIAPLNQSHTYTSRVTGDSAMPIG